MIEKSIETDIAEILSLAKTLCLCCKGDYVEDIWGQRKERIELEQAVQNFEWKCQQKKQKIPHG